MKDFWPGQQQFSNSLLVTTSENGPITPLVSDKSNTAANGPTSSLSHAPNVAKVFTVYRGTLKNGHSLIG